MKNKLLATALSALLATTACSYLDMKEVKTAKTAYSFEKFRPANMAISKDGRVFVTGHPIVNSAIKVIEVPKEGSSSVYPNDEYSNALEQPSVIDATIGIHVDDSNNLWILDLAKRQFVVWNIDENKLNRIIQIPESVLVKTSFLQDFVYDEKRNRIIIADMSQNDLKSAPQPAFVVLDVSTGKMQRVAQSHASMMPDHQGGLALNPIALDPTHDYLYFGAMHSKKIYRVKAAHFDNPETLAEHIQYYAPKSYSDGIKVDINHNVYVTDVEEQAIGVANLNGYKIIAKLPENQSWPDGMALWNGFVYTVVNQLNRTPALNQGVDATQGGFIIVKTPLYNP